MQSVGEPDDASRLEEVADRVLRDPAANESFLDEVLSPAAKQSRNFRSNLRDLISGNQRDANLKEISRELGYLVVWPPVSAIRLGDIGSFRSGLSFVVETQLGELRPDAALAEVVEAPAPDLRHSTSDVSVIVDGPVTRIYFGRAGAIFFAASGLRSLRIADYSEVERQIRSLLETGTWSADWDVVTEVLEADRVLLLVANGAGASVELRGIDLPRLGAVGESADVTRQNQMQFTFLGGPGVVPLFRAVEVSESRSQEIVARNTF